jgi:hypothetical protein
MRENAHRDIEQTEVRYCVVERLDEDLGRVNRTIVILGEDASGFEKSRANRWAVNWRADSTLGLVMDWLE